MTLSGLLNALDGIGVANGQLVFLTTKYLFDLFSVFVSTHHLFDF